MYYPSLFPTVRPFDPRSAPLGGPLEVPVLGTGRERENPLDLSVKTVRQTADSTAEAEELMMLDHRKLASLAASHSLSAMGRQLAPGASAPSLLDPSLFRFPYSTDSSACTHSGATLLPGFTPQFCLDRTPVSGVPPTLSNHPMMSSFLQQQQRDRCMEQHQAMYARTPQHVPFFDPASLPLHLRVGGGNLTPREAALLSSRGLYSPALPTPMALPAFSLYPDRLEEKGAFTSLRNPATDKAFLNGSSLDPARFTEHLQRLREQHIHQTAKCTGLCCAPLSGLSQPHAVSCACCLQNPSQSAVCNRGSVGCVTNKDSSKMCNGTCDFLPPGLSLLPRPTAADIRLSMGPYCAGLSEGTQRDEATNHLFQSSGLWSSGLPTTSKTAFSVPKKKDSLKDSSKVSKENSIISVSEKDKLTNSERKENSKSHSKMDGKRDEREVIVIEEEAVQRTPVSKSDLSRKVECEGKDKSGQKNQTYNGGLVVPKRDIDHPIVPAKMPLLEAVRPNEGAEPVEVPTCAASPLGPPPLVAAVNGPSSNKHPLQVSPSDKILLLPEFAGQSCQKPASPREASRSPKQAAKVSSPSVTCPRDDVVRAPIPRLPVISTAPTHLTPPHFASPLQPPTEQLFGELPVHHISQQQCDDTTVLQKLLALPTSDVSTAGSANLTNTCGLFPVIMTNDFESRQSKKRLAVEGNEPCGSEKRLKVTDTFPEAFHPRRDERLNCVQHPVLHFDRPERQHVFPECPRFPEYSTAPITESIPSVLSLKVEPQAEEPPISPAERELPVTSVKTERAEPHLKPRFAYFKPRALIKRSLKRTTFEDIRREAKRLAGLRAKRKLRRRLLARLYPRKQSGDESIADKRDNGESPLLAKLTLSWQPQRLLYNYQFVRRRRLRSGLDLISRHRRKKSSSSLSREEGKRLPQSSSISGKVTAADSCRSQGVPPELKRLMVNKALGETVLHRAARLGYSDVILYCLETNYCDVNARDNAGYTPLHECCSRGNLLIAAALLQYGADVNASAAGGIRPLHDAVENDHVELVRLLLSYGADPTIATYSGLVPLKLARSPIMGEFLQGFLADISGEIEGRPTLPWRFRGSARFLDPEVCGFDVFDGVPSDPEGEGEGDDDFLFEVSDSPHLPTYRLRLPAACSKAPCNYLKLDDVLSQTGLTRDRFYSLYGGGIDVVSIPRHQFEASATCSQLLTCTRLDSVESERTVVDVVQLDSRVRDILGIETITVR